MVTRTLTAADLDLVHTAFVDAFSDYVVPLRPERDRLLEMLTRRGWVPEASIAMVEEGRIVAFTLNGVRAEEGYDSGTGVIPSHRRRGLAHEVMLRSIDVLRAHGCTSYVLEVIEANQAAHELYRDLGFSETRRLQSWTYEHSAGAMSSDIAHSPALPPAVESQWDISPSWQNSTDSILSARDEMTVLSTDEGYAVVFPEIGDLAQLAVRRDARRRGVGRSLLNAAADLAGKPLRIMNVDERDQGISAFFERIGAKPMVRQLEMVLRM